MQPDDVVHVARSLQTGDIVARGRTFQDLCAAMESANIDKRAVIAEIQRGTLPGER